MFFRLLTALSILSLLFSCSGQTETEKLHKLIDREWSARLREYPTFATRVGVSDFNDRLTSMAELDLRRRNNIWQEILAELSQIDLSGLSGDEGINHKVLTRQLRERTESFRFEEHLIPLNADSGFHSSLAFLPKNTPFSKLSDYEAYIFRLSQFPRYFSEQINLMRQGLQKGITLPRVTLNGIETSIEAHIVEDPRESVFFEPFTAFPTSLPVSEHAQLAGAAEEVVREAVVPSYESFLSFMKDEYVPGCRTSLGASELPNGSEYYSYLVRHHTTLDLTPEQVHQIGKSEVERIKGEMEQIIRELDFKGDFIAFLEFLRTDPRFYVETGEELIRYASWIAKRMDGKLPVLFKTLPRLPYTVEPVPDSLAPKYTSGRYVGATLGGTRPGLYWVNTHALESRPLYALTALTLHEAVPGHHLQNALRQELTDLPNFRRFSGVTAYGEGWGLYAERLGLEVGFYENPFDNFGRLTYEMWRACRLVVDTGIHAMGWSREEAIEFLGSNTALSLHEVTTETDRYISWPGQALAYKIGEIKIRELRAKAQEALKERFDIREFHDVILLCGPIPLPILEERVDEYIERTKSS